MTRQLLRLAMAVATTATVLVPLTATSAAAAAVEIDCIDEDADDNATPYYDERFEPGPALSPTVLSRFIPQGLTTWRDYYGAGHDLLVYTGYHEDGDTRRAVIQGIDPRDGSLTNFARIGPGHAGGVAIYGKWAFVSAPGGTVRRYLLSELDRRFSGAETGPLDGAEAGDVVGPASFLAADGDILFVGKHDEDKRSSMRRYRIRDNATLTEPLGDAIRVSTKTQGAGGAG